MSVYSEQPAGESVGCSIAGLRQRRDVGNEAARNREIGEANSTRLERVHNPGLQRLVLRIRNQPLVEHAFRLFQACHGVFVAAGQ